MYTFRLATSSEAPRIWEILQQAIARRKADGSNQWQDGYPNLEVVHRDIDNSVGFVLIENDHIVGYTAVLINDEPEYDNIIGKWQTTGDFVVFHRVAVADSHLGKGLAKELFRQIELYARQKGIYSIKADTNFDNGAMLHIFESMGYVYCGEVYFRGSARRAYEKVID